MPGPTSSTSGRTRRVRLALVFLGAVGAAGAAVILSYVPPTDATFYPRCQLHSLTGLHCPGCGTTRSLHALLNGQITQALAYNALAFLVLPVVGWSLVQSLMSWALDSPVTRPSRGSGWLWALVAVMILFGVLRNLPWYPLTLLAPHEL